VKCGPETSRMLSLALISCFRLSVSAAPGDEYWDASFGVPGASDGVSALAVIGSDLIVAGDFTSIGGTGAVRIARFDGTNWHPLGDGLLSSSIATVRSLAAFRGCLYAAGAFTQAGATPVQNIARWDGTNWWPCGEGVSGSGLVIVRTMAVSGERLIVGGTFSVAGGLNMPNIAAWDGTNWTQLGSGIPGTAVDSIAASGTTIYAGGRFRLGGGINATNVAMWNGTAWLALGEGIRDWDAGGGGGGIVRTLLASESALVAGGAFRLAGRTNAANIAQWDGSTWRSLREGIDLAGDVYALGLNGTDLYVGGYFGAAGGVTANNVAKWDGSVWRPLGSGTATGGGAGSARALAVLGSELVVGGTFTSAGGKASSYIALWHIPHSLSMERTGNNVTLAWPATGTNFLLEATLDLGAPDWQGVSGTPGILNDQCVVTLAPGPGNQFFRLRRR